MELFDNQDHSQLWTLSFLSGISRSNRVDTNSRIDYWNGTLDWTIGLRYFPFLDKFLNSFLEAYFFMIYKYLVTIDDCNDDNSCVFMNK